MTFLSEIRTVSTPRPKLPPAPKRAVPKITSLEETLAAMKADADAWAKRRTKAWGQSIDYGDEPMPSRNMLMWTPEKEKLIAANIVAALEKNGRMTTTEVLAAIPAPKTRHKVKDTLTELHKAGRVQYTHAKRREWSLT